MPRPKQTTTMKGKDLKAGMQIRITGKGPTPLGLFAVIEEIGLPFTADGTYRARLQGFNLTVVIGETEDVEVYE